jgi:hypothetical protein
MSGTADFERAKEMFPSTTKLDEHDWVAYFTEHPEVVHAILGDIYVITKADRATVKKSGRRPRHINGNMDELWEMITPRYSTAPFGEALTELMGDQSLRGFSRKIPMHYWSLARLMRGERQIVNPYDMDASMQLLEQIAKAGKVNPLYFAEYRQLYIFKMFSEVFSRQPNFTIGLSKRLLSIEAQSA